MAKINKNIRPIHRIVTRSISRAFRGNLSWRDISSYVRIARNHDLERMLLERRNIRRSRRMSESNAIPAQNDKPKRIVRRRASNGSLNRSRQNAIGGGNQHPAVDPIVPFDDNFVLRMNTVIDEDILLKTPERTTGMEIADSNEIDEDILLKTPERTTGIEIADSNEIDEEMLLKTPEHADDNEAEDRPTNAFEEECQMKDDIESENMASGNNEATIEMEIDVIGVPANSTSNREVLVNADMNPRVFKPLPAPFHVRGRRPSAGCKKMLPLIEE